MRKKPSSAAQEYKALVEQFKSECREARIYSSIERHGNKKLLGSEGTASVFHALDERLRYHNLLPLQENWCELLAFPAVQCEMMLHWADPGPGFVLWPLEKAQRLAKAFRENFNSDARFFSNTASYTLACGGANFNPSEDPVGTSLCVGIIDAKKIGLLAVIEDCYPV